MATDKLINQTQGGQLISGLTAIASEIASINTNAVRPNSTSTTENDIMVYGGNAYTAKDSGVSIETAQISGTLDTKLPTSKNIKTNVAGTAVLTNYPSTTPTSIQSVESTDTITQAIKKVEDNTRINNNNILWNTNNGVKNLFNPTQQSASGTGYTLTRNADNTFHLVSTGTNSQQFFTLGTFTPTSSGTYLFTSGKVGSTSTCGVYVKVNDVYYWAGTGEGEGIELTLTGGTTYTVTCKLSASQTLDYLFKPMIRTQGDSTYQPYAMSNVELTEEHNQLGSILYARYLSDLTFTKSLGGLYYSNDIDISTDFDEVFSAGLANFSNVPNIAINTMLKENKSICVVVCDPTSPASLSFSEGSITIRVFGRKK